MRRSLPARYASGHKLAPRWIGLAELAAHADDPTLRQSDLAAKRSNQEAACGTCPRDWHND